MCSFIAAFIDPLHLVFHLRHSCKLHRDHLPSHTRTVMGESRTELLGWLNDLLQLSYTKVEQCGTGAAYCQVIDSIYGEFVSQRRRTTA